MIGDEKNERNVEAAVLAGWVVALIHAPGEQELVMERFQAAVNALRAKGVIGPEPIIAQTLEGEHVEPGHAYLLNQKIFQETLVGSFRVYDDNKELGTAREVRFGGTNGLVEGGPAKPA